MSSPRKTKQWAREEKERKQQKHTLICSEHQLGRLRKRKKVQERKMKIKIQKSLVPSGND
jgi:hypothetical protein